MKIAEIRSNFNTYIFSILICFSWFVVDFRYSSQSYITIFYIVKAGLFIIGLIMLGLHKKSIKFYSVYALLIWAIFTEILVNEESPLIALRVLLNLNLSSILLIPLFIDNMNKLKSFLNTFLLFAFVTVIVVGFFQYFTDSTINDFGKWESMTDFYVKNKRITGLIYPDTTVVAIVSSIFSLFILLEIPLKRKTLTLKALLLVGFTVLMLTFTRASWIAMVIALMIYRLYIRKSRLKTKGGSNYAGEIIAYIMIAVFIYFAFEFVKTYVLDRASIDVTERLSSEDNLLYRLERYSLFFKGGIQKVGIMGFGYVTDPTKQAQQIIGQAGWGTIHNQMLDFYLAFGLFTIALYYFIIKSIIRIKTIVFSTTDDKLKAIGLLLLLSQLFIFISESFASNPYYYSILILTLSEIFIFHYKKIIVSKW